MPALLVCVLMLALTPLRAHAQAATPIAEADDKEARDLFQIGKDAFDEGRFERALKYFRDAYELSHRAALLSNIGTVLDRLRRDQEALDAYRSYLEQVPEAPNRRQVEERIRIIEAALSRSQPAPPAPAAVTPTPPPGAASTRPEVQAPTPAETARAAAASEPRGHDPRHPTDAGSSPITSRWWFWTGIGAVAVAAVVVVVAVSAGGGSSNPDRPTLLDPRTQVREL